MFDYVLIMTFDVWLAQTNGIDIPFIAVSQRICKNRKLIVKQINRIIEWKLHLLLLMNTMPHIILQTHPNTKIAVTICNIAEQKHMKNALNQCFWPYSVLQPNNIAIEANKVPEIHIQSKSLSFQINFFTVFHNL